MMTRKGDWRMWSRLALQRKTELHRIRSYVLPPQRIWCYPQNFVNRGMFGDFYLSGKYWRWGRYLRMGKSFSIRRLHTLHCLWVALLYHEDCGGMDHAHLELRDWISYMRRHHNRTWFLTESRACVKMIVLNQNLKLGHGSAIYGF